MALANNILQLLPEAGREMPGSPYNSHWLLGMLRRVPASLTLTEYHSLKLVGFLEWKCWTEGQFNQGGRNSTFLSRVEIRSWTEHSPGVQCQEGEELLMLHLHGAATCSVRESTRGYCVWKQCPNRSLVSADNFEKHFLILSRWRNFLQCIIHPSILRQTFWNNSTSLVSSLWYDCTSHVKSQRLFLPREPSIHHRTKLQWFNSF